ncbi:hypothetical protein ACWEPN_21280 [Nonomuraea wenchangensis]
MPILPNGVLQDLSSAYVSVTEPEVLTVQDVDLHSGTVWRRIDGFTDRPELARVGDGERRLEDIVNRAADRLVEIASVL